MALNIKNDDTHRQVRELARLTGESQSEAVAKSVRERLERVRQRSAPDLEERITAIVEDAAPRWKEPWLSTDHGDVLYDDMGLPA